MSIMAIEKTPGLPKRIALIPIEGILRKPVGGQANPDGVYLYKALSEWYRVTLVTYETDAQRTKDWLDREGVFNYDDVLYGGMAILVTESYWANMIRIVRQRGGTPALVVVNGPQDALDVVNANVPVLLYAQPSYGLSEWLPGSARGGEEWATLVDKIETERSARINDRRMEEGV